MPALAPKRPPADPDSFTQAVAWFRSRLIMSDEEFSALEDVTHDQAFTVADVTQLDMVTEVWEALDRAVANGETLDDFRARIADKLTSAWGEERPYRVETIFRTNVQRAYSVGRFEQMEHPAVAKARPYRMFSAILDARNKDCPICPPIDQTVVDDTSAFYLSHQTPLHFNCRCQWVSLTPERAEELGITENPPAIEADEGFGQAPDLDWQPDLSEYPSALTAEW